MRDMQKHDNNTIGKTNQSPLPWGGVGGGSLGHFLNRSLIPSMSKERVKRRVWSSGLLCAVEMT